MTDDKTLKIYVPCDQVHSAFRFTIQDPGSILEARHCRLQRRY